MTPVRMLILAVLFYLAYRLLRSMSRDSARREFEAQRQQARETKVQDTLVEDPVCGRLVPKSDAVRLHQGGKTFFFCSETCCDEFIGKSGEKDQ
ncbi:MAG: TRASH domain protein [Desulfobulbus propionicus]|nr:MAG: TRASH domain protein [Desulfobulbus propionicus]